MELLTRVRRSLIWWLPLVIIVMGFHYAVAQGLPTSFGLESFSLGQVRISPEIQVGYQRLGLNFNLPAFVPGTLISPATLDLQLKKADLWVGSVGIRADLPSGLSLAIYGQANAKRNVTVFESQEFVLIGRRGVTWAGTPEWWAIDGQVMYRVRNDLSIMAGLRRDHLSLNLSDPTDANGSPLNFDQSGVAAPIALPFHRTQQYASDLLSKLWIPYLGLEFARPWCKASIIGSPFASAEMQIPASQLFDLTTFIGPFFAELRLAEGMRYRVSKPAIFLEGNFQYDWNVSPGLTFGMWCKASWMSLRGKGAWDANIWSQVLGSFVNFRPNTENDHQEHLATYTRSVLGAGLSAVAAF